MQQFVVYRWIGEVVTSRVVEAEDFPDLAGKLGFCANCWRLRRLWGGTPKVIDLPPGRAHKKGWLLERSIGNAFIAVGIE